MQATAWRQIVARLNASFPAQEPIGPETAAEWFEEVRHLDEGDVWLAVRELRKEQTWRPSLAELLAGVRVYRAALAERAHHQALERAGDRKGTPMPPETRQALEILKETTRPDVTADFKAQARQMIDTLADQLAERVAVERLVAGT